MSKDALPPATPEQLNQAIANWQLNHLVTNLLFTLTLAAERDPEGVKKALQSVFSPGAVAATYRKAERQSREAANLAAELTYRVKVLSGQVAELEKRRAALEYELERVEAEKNDKRKPAARAG